MSRKRSGSAAGHVGALFARTNLLPLPGGRSGPQLADITPGEHHGDARPLAASGPGRVGTVVASHPYLLLAVVAVTLAGMLLALHPHADLLRTAFGVSNTSGAGSGKESSQAATLYKHVQSLSTDALYVLLPSASLAGAVGGIFWAAGSRRGPSIVGGAIVAGVVGAALRTIVQ
jgi:hypothetical protein